MKTEFTAADVIATTIGGLLGLTIVSVVVVPLALGMLALDAWVVTYYWQWFVVPIFHMQLIGIPAAMGLCLTFRLFKGNLVNQGKPEKDKTPAEKQADIVNMCVAIATPFLMLGIGWLIQHLWVIQ